MTRSGWIAIGLLGCLPLVAKAGVVWEMARDSDTTWPAGGFRFTADRGRVRVEHFAASGEPSSISIVVDGTQSTFSSRQKTVDVCDPQCMTELAEQPAAIRRAQEAQLAQVPERHRESMRQGMGLGPQPAVSVRKTERVEVVGQYRCSLWEVTVSERVVLDVCAVPFSKVSGGQELGQAYDADRQRWRAHDLAMRQHSAAQVSWAEFRPPLEIQGLPVPVRVRDRRFTPARVIVIRSVRTTAVADDAFQVPAGLQVRDVGKSLPDLDSAAKTATLTPEQQRAQQKMWEMLDKVKAEEIKRQGEKPK